MRDTAIARRTLLAFAAGYGICAWAAAPAEARRRTSGPRRPPAKPRLVALDPGHGGVDPGAISPKGLYEKTVTLAGTKGH
jgi:N-acetylmuramoyl-L-alanine amidase